jgi:hypothetical protein
VKRNSKISHPMSSIYGNSHHYMTHMKSRWISSTKTRSMKFTYITRLWNRFSPMYSTSSVFPWPNHLVASAS